MLHCEKQVKIKKLQKAFKFIFDMKKIYILLQLITNIFILKQIKIFVFKYLQNIKNLTS